MMSFQICRLVFFKIQFLIWLLFAQKHYRPLWIIKLCEKPFFSSHWHVVLGESHFAIFHSTWLWKQIPAMTEKGPQNMAQQGIVQKGFICCILTITKIIFSRAVNKQNICFEQCAINPLTNIDQQPLLAFMGKWEWILFICDVVDIMLGWRLRHKASSSFTLLWFNLLAVNHSFCVGDSQIKRNAFLLCFIGSTHPWWENVKKCLAIKCLAPF